MFRADPRRRDEPTLESLRSLVRPSDTVLDVGAGGGRYALPLALGAQEVIAVDPSEGMLRVLREGMAAYEIANIRVVGGRWPAVAAGLAADVVLIAHLGYDVEDIGPFLDAMEAAARRTCVAVLLEQPPPTEADRCGRPSTASSAPRCRRCPSFWRCCWRGVGCSRSSWSIARRSRTSSPTRLWPGCAASCGSRLTVRKTCSCSA